MKHCVLREHSSQRLSSSIFKVREQILAPDTAPYRPAHYACISYSKDMDGADGVYPASEDTHLLIDALEADAELLRGIVKGYGLCLEVGSGSGTVSAALAKLLGRDVAFVATDINALAASKTKELLASVKSSTDVVMGSLFSCFRPANLFEVVVFNPPYVPTDDDELRRAYTELDIAASWAGGKDGRVVIDRFLRDVSTVMATDALVYIVALDLNRLDDLLNLACECGLAGTIVLERVAGMERLYILRFRKNSI